MVAPKVSVIIPIWNGSEYLNACLDSLIAHDYPIFEIIAVDNASVDGSAELIARRYPQVRLIRNAVNLGFAGGCNAGLKAAHGDILVLLNQDTIVQPGWLQALVKALQKTKIGVVGCKMLYPDGRTIQHAGGWIEWPLGLAHHYGQGEQDKGQWDESRPVDYVTGAAMAFRRDVLENVGYMDEGFWPAYYEDVDFCFRARQIGYEIWYIHESLLLHFENSSLKNTGELFYFSEKNRLYFVLKYLIPEKFLSEFVPLEKTRILDFVKTIGVYPLRLAYLSAMPIAARVLMKRQIADEETVNKVLLALRSLYHLTEIYLNDDLNQDEQVVFSGLQEFEFRSAIPIIGPLIAWFRKTWYNVAARWAIRHLIQQQAAINKRQEQIILEQKRKIFWLERSLMENTLSLSQEIARLLLESK